MQDEIVEFNIKEHEVHPEATRIIEENMVHEKKIFPYKETDKEVFVAMVDPTDMNTITKLKIKFKKRIIAARIAEEDFYMLINRYFGVGAGMLYQVASDINISTGSIFEDFNIDDNKGGAEIIQFVNKVILDAYKRGATDIHLEPIKKDVLLRYRIDGVLHNITIPPSIKAVYHSIVSRIKIMSNLDIAEKRLPQDGRIKIIIGKNENDLRVSVLPTINGEAIVIRILANQKGEMELEKLGMEGDLLVKFRELINRPNGIMLVTGPTGSGKTTTLFSAIKEINDLKSKIITIEDPVEYQLDGVSQIQVKPEIGLTFAEGLRAILRQDPDIVLVGEIRDRETAEIAIRASLTGHLVFATLHTNDSISSVTRLIDMGIEPYLITSSLIGVLAQRLVRMICPYCKTETILDNGEKNYYGKGCDYCFGTGYKGRSGIHELFLIDDMNKKDILNGKSNFEIKAHLVKEFGWKDLKADGMNKAKQGITTYDEIYRTAW